MSKIAINELFYELGTIEQKTYKGGAKRWKTTYVSFFRYGTVTGPQTQSPPRVPRLITPGLWPDPSALEARPDLYGW